MRRQNKAIHPDKNKKKQTADNRLRPWAVAVWLAVWELASLYIGQEILLVSPVSVLRRLTVLAVQSDFWGSIAFSFFRIIGGFLLASLCGTLLASLSAAFRFVRDLLAPAMAAIKAVPVASFIILVLIWVPSRNLSVVISFRIPLFRRIRYIYLSQLLPYLRTGFSLSLGLCWKAGVAAEVIGIPKGSIGEKLYEAKVYLETPDLFSWTLVIVLISVIFEKLFLRFIDKTVALIEKM